jgi:hypothetical protein
MLLYRILDVFFIVFHSLLILFNLFGWLWKKTRPWNLLTLVLTGGSWSILGIFYGFGYCPLTDWHFNILYSLGKTNLPNSYVKYLADRLTGLAWDARLIDKVTLISFLLALSLSLFMNFVYPRLKKPQKS